MDSGPGRAKESRMERLLRIQRMRFPDRERAAKGGAAQEVSLEGEGCKGGAAQEVSLEGEGCKGGAA